jgi:hypothetical protein
LVVFFFLVNKIFFDLEFIFTAPAKLLLTGAAKQINSRKKASLCLKCKWRARRGQGYDGIK